MQWLSYVYLVCMPLPSGLSIQSLVYSVYAPGRHWITCLSPSNLPDALVDTTRQLLT